MSITAGHAPDGADEPFELRRDFIPRGEDSRQIMIFEQGYLRGCLPFSRNPGSQPPA